MLFTPARRLTAGASAAAILAGAFLIPAAVAAADELPEAAADAVVEELQDSESTESDQAPADETPASVDGDELADQADDAETAQQEAARSQSDDATADARVAAAADEPQTEISEIAPGDTLELRHDVVGARNVYLYVIGPDLEVYAQRPDSLISVPESGTNVHGGEYGWTGRPDGTWSIRITNRGSQPVTPAYGFSYDTPANALHLGISSFQPAIDVTSTPIIGGENRGDLTMHSEVLGPDGSVLATRQLESLSATRYNVRYEGLATGTYVVRVWTTVDGITVVGSRPVEVYEAETEPPVVTGSIDPSAPGPYGWYSAPVTVTITMSDAGSGVVALNYTLDDGPTLASTTATTRLEFGDDGEHVLRYQARDHQWNWSEPQELAFKIDRTAPVIALYGLVEGAQYAVGEDVFVEYQCSDATSRLVGDDCTADRPSDSRIDTSTPGDYVFHIEATDLAGNRTVIDRRYSVLAPDTTDPVVEVDVPEEPASGWYLDEVTVRLSASDESGIRRIHYEYDTMQTTVSRDVEDDSVEITFDRTQLYSLSYWAEDNAGNRSEGRTLNLYVDSDAPWIDVYSPDEDELTLLPNGHFAQHERVEVDFRCDDIGSGIVTCDATTPDGELLPTGTPGTHELRIVATDLAGHRTERVVTYTVDPAPAPGSGSQGGAVGGATGGRVLATTGTSDVVPGLALAVLLLGAGATIAIRRRVRTR